MEFFFCTLPESGVDKMGKAVARCKEADVIEAGFRVAAYGVS